MKKQLKWCSQQLLLWDGLTGAMLFHIAFPVVHQFLVSNLSPRLIALESIVISVGSRVTRLLFNRDGNMMFKLCPVYLCIETVVYGIICWMIYVGAIAPRTFFLIEVTVIAIASQCIMCCGTRMRRLLYSGETREYFDNCMSIAFSAGGIIGACIALVGISLSMGWIVIFINVVLTDIFVGVIWWRTRNMKGGGNSFLLDIT
jgi:hypothetical protein